MVDTHRLAAVSGAVSVVGLSAVGLFPSGDPLHVPVAVTHFVGVTAMLAVDAVVRRGERTGQAAGLAALVHAAGWIGWGAGVLPPGLAIPEFVGAVALASWVLAALAGGLAGYAVLAVVIVTGLVLPPEQWF